MRRRQFFQSAAGMAAALALLPHSKNLAAEMMKVNRDVEAISATGRELVLAQTQIQALGDGLGGNLLLPGNPAYELARLVRNASIDKHPALIVQPSGAADVGLAVDFARDNNLVTAVKCGGHSTAGKSTCNGGMMIDLSLFRHVRVDPRNKVAAVSGGSLLGAMDHETMAHGLVTVAGTVSHTGVGGLTTGGGFGRLARRYGLALDNVQSLDIVSADGKLRHASAEENPDLYWGVRGAGGNFGVVTSFEFNLHEMSRTVMAGNFVYPIERLRDVLEFYAEFSPRAPDELAIDFVAAYPPAGKPPVVVLSACYSGDAALAGAAMAPVKKLGKPLMGGMKPVDYVALQRSNDSDAPRVNAAYLKGGFTSEITPQLIDTIVGGIQPHPQRTSSLIFQQAGGAIKGVSSDATAFAHRYAEHNMMLTMAWQPDDPSAEHVKAIKSTWSRLMPYTHGFYVNEADDDNAVLTSQNYQGNYARLLGLKKRYDPTNIFRLNANIDPLA
jgi:FAD/FMN-containing dehydrogenase